MSKVTTLIVLVTCFFVGNPLAVGQDLSWDSLFSSTFSSTKRSKEVEPVELTDTTPGLFGRPLLDNGLGVFGTAGESNNLLGDWHQKSKEFWGNAGRKLSDVATQTKEAWDSARERWESPGWQFFSNENKWALPQTGDWGILPESSHFSFLPSLGGGQTEPELSFPMPSPRIGRSPDITTKRRF